MFSCKDSPKETRTYSHFYDGRKFHHWGEGGKIFTMFVCFFFDFYCISMAVTNITLYVVWHLKHGGIISFYI